MSYKLIAALLLLPSAAFADWSWDQRPGFASAKTISGNYVLELSCRRGDQALEMTLYDQTLLGRVFQGLSGVMVWIELPDGRLHRQPVDLLQEGASASGPFIVSDFVMDIFRNARSYRVDMPLRGGELLMDGNMRGSGAARLAFLEQCGI